MMCMQGFQNCLCISALSGFPLGRRKCSMEVQTEMVSCFAAIQCQPLSMTVELSWAIPANSGSAAKKVSLGRVCGVERVGVVGSSWALGADFTDLWTERHLVPCSQLWVSKLMFYCSLPVCLVPSIPWLSQTRFLGTAADCLERISSLVLFKLRCLRKVEQSYNLHFSKCLWCINIAKALRNGKYHFFNFTSFENSMSFQKEEKFIMGEHQTSCRCFYL